ncbi:MAG: hypothetical protein B6I24_05950 [Bacteroidetes bacterium 4572_128]|nr:MAG: hypothetical protein B6I24_05950 [Bacteroidetes bacterium 4572_128]
MISRNRKILSEFKEIFRAKNIPYYIPSVQDKFVGQEINALLYLLKSIVNENDKIAIYRLCQFYNIDYNHVSYNDNLTLLQQFTKILKEENIVNLIKEIINDKVNFFKYIEKYMSEFDKKEDIDAFTEYYRNFNHTEEIKNLANFLNYIALYSNNKVIENAVALLTGHTAKGLEFDNVFLVSMNEGIFPDFRAKKGRKLEEERRNCYVAITRTKQKLFLSYTERKDTYYGDREHQPSRFLKEMELI